MIETREAVTNAAQLAKQSEFFSFGTNDLTQEITGLKRDDIEGVDKWMFSHHKPNPFATLNDELKASMTQAVEAARGGNANLKISACGDQVSCDQSSIAFCQSLNLNAISVPANLASQATSSVIAGQEAMKSKEEARALSAERKASGIRTLADADDGRSNAINPDTISAQRQNARHRGQGIT